MPKITTQPARPVTAATQAATTAPTATAKTAAADSFDTQTQATITASSANVRASATTSAAKVGALPQGTTVAVLDSKKAADGYTWLHVGFSGGDGTQHTGWVRGDLARVRAAPTPAPTPTPNPTPAPSGSKANWDYSPGTTGGVFSSPGVNPHPTDELNNAAARFPGSKTFLWYKSVGGNPEDLPKSYFDKAQSLGIVPQIGFESGDLSLPDLKKALAGKGLLTGTDAASVKANQTYSQLAAWADHLKGMGPVIFRPMSEMNDASGAWEMGKPGNTPQDYAAVWNGMHDLFEQHGATNLRWSFDVLAVAGASRSDMVKSALKLIPAKNIDNVAVNPYAMQVNGKYESFASLVDPWMQIFQDTGHGNTRPVVSEMGVSNNPKSHNVDGNKDPNYVGRPSPGYDRLDAQRAQWIHDAFAYARTHHFASVTYFTQMNTNWRVDPGSLAEKALADEVKKGA